MASTETLGSLAMLKVNIDQGKDYLDYLRPFIQQVLVDHKPDPVTDHVIRKYLLTQFGLEIPTRAVNLVLKRMAKVLPLVRRRGVYHITDTLPDPGIAPAKSGAERHIRSVIAGLLEFDKTTSKSLADENAAVTALCSFLSEFNIPCLRAYLRGTTIPTVADKQHSHIILISDYVLQLQRSDPERFESFMILVQGHMLANALLCPDLHSAPKTYKGVTFYLDTPLLVQRLGLEGEPKKRAAEELIALVRNLGGVIATFSHSREELGRVLKGATANFESRNVRSAIVFEARRNGMTRSDLLLMAEKADELLAEAGIEVQMTPKYTEQFQIDEKSFEQALEDEISYFNPRAREYDINSVRSIYVLRANTAPVSLEKAKAVLVSNNTGFARAAYDYGKQHEESREVSSVITDFSLANMAWLKAPMGAPTVPMTELLAYSYAALRPSNELLDKYLSEIDKLQKNGKISERDHQLLRSSPIAQEELMRLTLGDDASLTEETISQTLQRVMGEIRKEDGKKIDKEKESHKKTQDALAVATAASNSLKQRIYWKSKTVSDVFAWTVSSIIAVLLFFGLLAGWGMKTRSPLGGWSLMGGTLVLGIGTLANAFFGTTVKQIHSAVQTRCLTYLLRRESKATGINFGSEE